MAAKDSKGTNSINIAEYFSGAPEGKMLIDIRSLNELLADTKRVQAINMDTIFDNMVKKLLLSHFSQQGKTVEELFDTNIRGPLVSLTHKAKLLYALGLIDKIARKDLEYIHRIRNKFAHSVEASFADTEVVKCVRKLSAAKDQEITERNSYKFYHKALGKCKKSLIEAFNQEMYRQAMLLEAKKKSKGKKPTPLPIKLKKVKPIKLKKVKPIKLKKVKSALKKSTR